MQCKVFTQTPDKLNLSSSDKLSPILETLRVASRMEVSPRRGGWTSLEPNSVIFGDTQLRYRVYTQCSV